MQDNRWCEHCGSDRTTKKVQWYLVDDNEEMSFCTPCVTDLRASDVFDTIVLIKD